MPNFNNWRNWRTNLLIRLGFHDLAQNYAYDFVGNDIKEEKKEEEVDLLPTVMAWKFFRRAWRAATNALTFGGVQRSYKKAKGALRASQDEAKRAAKNYEETRSALDSDIRSAKKGYETQRAIEKAQLSKSAEQRAQAAETLKQTQLEGKRSVAFSKKLTERSERAAQKRTLIEQQEAAKRTKDAKAGVSGPGRASTKVTGPRTTGTGKAGSVTGSARKLRRRITDEKTNLNI